MALFSMAPPAIAEDSRSAIYELDSAGDALDKSIPSPTEFLTLKMGSRAVRNDEVILYFRHLAKNSDRVIFTQYGETPSGQALVKLTISSPENLKNLDKIKSNFAKIDQNLSGNDRILKDIPAVAWMGYGIHGNEISSTDAAVMLAYRLAAGESPEIRAVRQNVITHIDPMFNPDGRIRALSHVDVFRRKMPSTDPQDIVHGSETWPGGRGNKYLFDLNRDALYQTQIQSQQRVNVILEAGPQMFIDSHEMGSDDTYLFAVPARPHNPHLPDEVHDSWLDIAKDHSAAFDLKGISYYTRSWDEVFYPGYFDTWPAYYGAVPILYEQAATSGLTVKKPNGKILTFEQAVSNHYRSSVANLMTLSNNKERFIRRWATARDTAEKNGAKLARKSYILLPDNKYKYREILRILLTSGIKVERLEKQTHANSLHSYWDTKAQGMTLPTGSLKIDLAQPLSNLVRNIFDYHIPMSEEFLRREKNNLDLGHATQLYDITAWSLPLAYNAPVFWTEKSVKGSWKKVTSLESVIEKSDPVGASSYGYIYKDDSLFATARLLEKGLKIRIATKAFTHRSLNYPRGAFLIRTEDQSGDITQALNEEIAKGTITVAPTQTARILKGPDLGGGEFTLLERRNIALIGGAGIDSTSFGAAWHLLDQEIGLPATLLDTANMGYMDLSRYNVLILPNTEGSLDLKKIGLEKWVKNGGILISLGNATLKLSDQGLIDSQPRSKLLEEYPPLMAGRSRDAVTADDFLGFSTKAPKHRKALLPVISPMAHAFTGKGNKSFKLKGKITSFAEWLQDGSLNDDRKGKYIQKIRSYLPHGAYLKAYLKDQHTLTYGMADKVPVLFQSSDVLIGAENAELIGRFAEPETLMMSGLLWPEAVGYIAGGAYLLTEYKGNGAYVLFANDPIFRGYSVGTARLFMNALIMGGK